MKSIIGRTAGALGLGAALLVTGCSREASTLAAAANTSAGAIVNCGEGRQAMVRPVMGSTVNQIECVPVAPVVAPYATAYAPAPVATAEAPVRERIVERVVYKQAPAARQSVVHRTESVEPVEPVYRRPSAEPAVYRTSDRYPTTDRYPQRTSYPASSDDRYPVEEERRNPRSWKKSAVIIGGAAAGGAGVGAIIGGKSGAVKGAVLGGVAGTVFDIATRNK